MASAGKVSPITRGVWNSTASYTRLDIVTNSQNTKSYICKKDNTNTPLENTEFWQVLVNIGDASGIEYDNTTSGMTATNVKDALDELASQEIELDDAMSDTSENAVQNKVIKEYVDDKTSVLAEISYNNAGAHNAIYRGKFLGNSVTDAQYSAIANGTFEDLYIGDYWTIGSVNWRIAHFDYWLHTGDTECTKHHVVIVPDTILYSARMNATNVTTGAYVGSEMYTQNLEQAKTIITTNFGAAHVLTHRALLANITVENRATNWSWYDSDIELMNESMVYGSPVGSKPVDNSTNFNVGIDKSQLALFALDPSRITNRAIWWLRCVVSSTDFASVYSYGTPSHNNASDSRGVRPAFGLVGN